VKITRKDYDKAKASLPKLAKAQETVKAFDKGIASRPEIDPEDIIAIEVTPSGPVVTCKPKEVKDAPRIHTA